MRRARAALKLAIFGRLGWFRYYGTRVHFPPGSLQFRQAVEQGVYERETLLAMLRLARPGTTVLEVGANIGLIAVPLLATVPGCRVVSFEPSPNSLPSLERTRSGSGFGERWRIVPKAAAAAAGRRAFFAAAPGAGAFDGLRDTGRAGPMREVGIEATTLDAEWEGLGRPAVSLVKIDVEGAEAEVLAGAAACLRLQRPWVVLEWNAANLAAHGCPPERLLEIASGMAARVYALPALAAIADRQALAHAMAFGESFLLAPEVP